MADYSALLDTFVMSLFRQVRLNNFSAEVVWKYKSDDGVHTKTSVYDWHNISDQEMDSLIQVIIPQNIEE